MEEKDITEDVLPEESGDELPAVDTPSDDDNGHEDNEPALTLKEINEKLGKEFPDLDTALKSVKDTYSYVGKKKDDVKEEVKEEVKTDQNFMTKTEYERERFYDKNPDYVGFEKLLGNNPTEALKDSETKSIITDAIEHRKSAGSKSVIHSNARVADKSSDYSKDLTKAQKTGNWAEFLEKHKGLK